MKFLLIDDYALIREALSSVLQELRGDAIVFAAASCRQGMDLICEHSDISLVLLDLHLPDRDGFDMLAELRESYPVIGVVMLSAFNDRDNVVRALDQGALGFISKTSSRDVLLGALRVILAGEVYFPPEILGGAAALPEAQSPNPHNRVPWNPTSG
jgi:DNA-binding NarL/FixJ family response regulator